MKLAVAWAASGEAPGAPDLSQSGRLALEQWTGDHVVAWGCVGGDASVWSEDATELAQDRLVDLAVHTAEAMRGTPVTLTAIRALPTGRTLESSDGAVYARTFLAFTEGRVHGCLAVTTSDAGRQAVKDAALAEIRGGELRAAPGPGVVLGVVGAALRHPHGSLAVVGGVLALGAALAIVTRPRR